MDRVLTSWARSLECFIPRSTRDLFPVPAAVNFDTALQLGAHYWVILSWRRFGPGYFVFSFLFLALGPYTPEGKFKKKIITFAFNPCNLYYQGYKNNNNNNKCCWRYWNAFFCEYVSVLYQMICVFLLQAGQTALFTVTTTTNVTYFSYQVR